MKVSWLKACCGVNFNTHGNALVETEFSEKQNSKCNNIVNMKEDLLS